MLFNYYNYIWNSFECCNFRRRILWDLNCVFGWITSRRRKSKIGIVRCFVNFMFHKFRCVWVMSRTISNLILSYFPLNTRLTCKHEHAHNFFNHILSSFSLWRNISSYSKLHTSIKTILPYTTHHTRQISHIFRNRIRLEI